MTKILKILSYVLFGVVALLVFVYLTFPTDTLGEVIVAQGEAALGFEYDITIDDVGLAGLAGLNLEGVRIVPRGESGDDQGGEDGGETTDLDDLDSAGPPRIALPTVIDEATVTAKLFSLFGGRPRGSASLTIGEGTIDASWDDDPEREGNYLLTLSLRAVSIQSIGLILNKTQAPISGQVTGAVELSLDAGLNIKAGIIKLVVATLSRGTGWQPIGDAGVTFVTPARLGNLWLLGTVNEDDGSADLTLSNRPAEDEDLVRMLAGVTHPVDIELHLEGRLTLRRPFGESLSRSVLQVAFQDEWVTRNEFSSAFRAVPILRQSCDGASCAMTLSGPIAQARLQPLRRGR